MLQLNEVGRPLQDHVVGQIQLLETKQFDQRFRQRGEVVVAQVKPYEVLELHDVLGDVGYVVAGEMQLLETVSERKVERQRLQSVVRQTERLPNTPYCR